MHTRQTPACAPSEHYLRLLRTVRWEPVWTCHSPHGYGFDDRHSGDVCYEDAEQYVMKVAAASQKRLVLSIQTGRRCEASTCAWPSVSLLPLNAAGRLDGWWLPQNSDNNLSG